MQDSLKPGSHSILTIPPEICELVFSSVEPNDLISLRQVSREISRRADNQFLETWFGRRAFLLSREDSLRRLLTITEDVRYAQSMKTIDFCIVESPAERAGDIAYAPIGFLEWLYKTSTHFTGPKNEKLNEEKLPYSRADKTWRTLIKEKRGFSRQRNRLSVTYEVLLSTERMRPDSVRDSHSHSTRQL